MSTENDETAIERLFFSLLTAWNHQDASGFAALFTADANVVGFDGSQMDGQTSIETTLQAIFADHQTGRYIGKVREIRLLNAQTALLRAVCGMIPAGHHELNPALNTIQSMVATKHSDTWRIALFHNTPAQFHGRPEAVETLTDELRQSLQS